MDSDKKATVAGSVSGISLVTAGLAMVHSEPIAGAILIVAGVALVALGVFTNKSL